jgi:hypothetical protein
MGPGSHAGPGSGGGRLLARTLGHDRGDEALDALLLKILIALLDGHYGISGSHVGQVILETV